MPEFEVFVDRHRSPPGQHEVGIDARGIFALNLAAYRALGEPAAVELLFAADEQLRSLGNSLRDEILDPLELNPGHHRSDLGLR